MRCRLAHRSWISSSFIVEILQFLSRHIRVKRSSSVRSRLFDLEGARLEYKPLNPTNKLRVRWVKSAPFEHRRATVNVCQNLIDCPPDTLFTHDLGKILAYRCCAYPFSAPMKVKLGFNGKTGGNCICFGGVASPGIFSNVIRRGPERRSARELVELSEKGGVKL